MSYDPNNPDYIYVMVAFPLGRDIELGQQILLNMANINVSVYGRVVDFEEKLDGILCIVEISREAYPRETQMIIERLDSDLPERGEEEDRKLDSKLNSDFLNPSVDDPNYQTIKKFIDNWKDIDPTLN